MYGSFPLHISDKIPFNTLKLNLKKAMKIFRRKNNKNEFLELLPHAIAMLKKNIIEPFFGENNSDKYADERLPLRSEILTKDRLEQHAVTLAKRHVLIYKQKSEKLLKRLAENEKILLEVYAL